MSNFQLTLPGHYFTSESVFRDELEHIFYERWICVGRAEQIEKAGQYFLVEIGDESVIVLRDQASVARAFYNVCRHRGTRLCEAEHGQLSHTIQCPYHAWTYSLDGGLVGAPDMHEVPEFNKAHFPLNAVALEIWQGFLFLNLARQPQPFAEAFAPVLNRFNAWQMPTLRRAKQIEYNVKANWKLIAENYNECYHCPLVHPALNKLSNYRSGADIFTEGPIIGGYMNFTQGHATLSLSGHALAAPVGEVMGDDLNRVYYFALFPNLLLSLHPDYVMFHTLWPQAPGRTRILCEWLFDPAAMAKPDFDDRDAVEFWDMTNQQDWHACEISQLGVRSRGYIPGPYYSVQESLLAEFDRQVLTALGHPLPN